jgi:hypothetical protein
VKFKDNIKQIGAAFLMLLFLLAATPKKFLHDAIAEHHQHTKVEVQHCNHHHINIAAAGFNCQLDNLVVEMPFTIAIEPTFTFKTITYNKYDDILYSNAISSTAFTAFLRGPPAY